VEAAELTGHATGEGPDFMTSQLSGKNVLVLYNETQTFTSTVFEHLDSLARYSQARVFFAHQDHRNPVTDFSRFDAVIVHYSIRLPFDQIAEPTATALTAFQGLKAVFIQDEYDYTRRAWHWIQQLGIRLVFSSVPGPSMSRVYPPSEFPNVRFVTNLTGYAPDVLDTVPPRLPASQRPLKIGYRGRPLPIRYGALGLEKTEIGRPVKAYCESAGIEHDIAWQEGDRLYGDEWNDFIASCRAVLGTESGSNVFDWDGTLPARLEQYRAQHPGCSDREVYDAIIAPLDLHGLMNQASSRVFEAIACRTALVLFEGNYSGVVEPDRHFIPLRRDGSNLPDVIERLRDGAAIDAMTERAFDEVLAPGKYGSAAFVRMVDSEVAKAMAALESVDERQVDTSSTTGAVVLRTRPHRHRLVREPAVVQAAKHAAQGLAPYVPTTVKDSIKEWMRKMLFPAG
jgi:hypothetical protein